MTNPSPLSLTSLSILSIVALTLSLLFALSSGSVDISISEVLYALYNRAEHNALNSQIIWEIRLPRILMAALTGAGLAITGAVLQTITRNPLADPYLFGISSGASLGAVSTLFFGTLVGFSALPISLGALMGAMLSVFLMLSLAGKQVVKVDRLLLSGVAVSFMLSAFTSLILYYSEPEVTSNLLFWMMGSFSNSQWPHLIMPAITLSVTILIVLVFRHWIAAIQTGDDSALTLGVPVNQLRLFLLLLSAILTGALVAQVGAIAFVGLMIPHIVRLIVGARFVPVFIISLLLGALFMIWVDVIARSIFEHQVLPIGIVTSAIGSVFFFVILKSRKF